MKLLFSPQMIAESESHGVDMRNKAECGHTVAEIRLVLEEHGMVKRYESPSHDDRPQQSHKMRAQMEVAQSVMCKGQDCSGMAW